MKFVMFQTASAPKAGVLQDDGNILDLVRAAELTGHESSDLASVLSVVQGGDRALDQVRQLEQVMPDEAIVSAAAARLRCPVAPPRMRDTLMFLEHMQNGLDKWARNLAAEEEDPEEAYAKLKVTGRYDVAPVFRQQVIYYNTNHVDVSGPDDVIVWPAHSNYADF